MYRWVPYALVRITIFFSLGILLAIYSEVSLSRELIIQIALSLSGIYLICWFLIRKSKFYKLNLVMSLIAFLSISLLGYYNLTLHNEALDKDHFKGYEEFDAFIAKVQEPAYQTTKTKRYLVEVEAVHVDDWTEASGKVYVYIHKDDSSTYHYGDRLMIYGKPRELNSPQNPGEFDYKRFLSFESIYHQVYSTGENITHLDEERDLSPLKKVYQLRSMAKSILNSAISSEREQNIALALILGVKDGLTDDIKNAYSASGAMHVLAVSGLHVGIIYGIILMLFGKMQRSRSGRWALAFICLLSLWLYAAVTGLSPSVLRAVTMFSFVAIAKATGRNTNIYNTLAASALVLLLFDPYLIMSVGFQLSYLAVLGIVYIQPKVYRLLILDNVILDKIWVITSVSIAAQLATFTLGLLYFHQFPTFFLLSNLFVIPGAFLILIGGIGILLFYKIAFIGSSLGWLLSQLIFWLNEIVFWIEKLPNSMITDIFITTPQSWMLMVMILSVFLLFQKRKLAYLIIGCSVAVLFAYQRWGRVLNNKPLNQITVYRINNTTAIDWINSGMSTLLTDSILWNDDDKMRFHVRPNHLRSGVNEKYFKALSNEEGVLNELNICKKKLTLVNQPLYKFTITQNIQTDFLIISNGFKGKVKDLIDSVDADKIILDGSLSYYDNRRFSQELDALNLQYYSIFNSGAITLPI